MVQLMQTGIAGKCNHIKVGMPALMCKQASAYPVSLASICILHCLLAEETATLTWDGTAQALCACTSNWLDSYIRSKGPDGGWHVARQIIQGARVPNCASGDVLAPGVSNAGTSCSIPTTWGDARGRQAAGLAQSCVSGREGGLCTLRRDLLQDGRPCALANAGAGSRALQIGASDSEGTASNEHTAIVSTTMSCSLL